MSNRLLKEIIAKVLIDILFSELYCKIHRKRLIHLKQIDNKGDIIEVGYCTKCNKEYCEYSDISPIYISNYEWIYGGV